MQLFHTTRIQRWWRKNMRKRRLQILCSNWNDIDPISLEPILDIPLQKLFFLTCSSTHNVHACDAVAWASYFATNGARIHPCTREQIHSKDMWNCFITAYNFLPTELRNKFQSSEVYLRQTSETNLCILPVSPLLDVSILELSTKPLPHRKQKTCRFVYRLLDPRNAKPLTRPIRINMTIDTKMQVQII